MNTNMNMNMDFKVKLPIPADVKAEYPLDAKLEEIVLNRNNEINEVFAGKSDKFVLVIGPCSADNEDSVLEYISRLRTVQDKVSDKI